MSQRRRHFRRGHCILTAKVSADGLSMASFSLGSCPPPLGLFLHVAFSAASKVAASKEGGPTAFGPLGETLTA